MAKLLDETPDIVYSIQTHEDDYLFDYASNNVRVVGEMRKALNYDLNKLMESDSPKHKEIFMSLVINTVENNLYNGFKCLLYKNYQIRPLNNKNQTVLHLAFYNGSRGCVLELEDYLESEHCKKTDQTDYTDVNGLTHLHVACAMGGIKLIDNYSKTIENINIHYISPSQWGKLENGFTPLHFVMTNFRYQNKEMVQLLIERGSDVNAVDDMGRTPLHLIASLSEPKNFNKNILEIMKALLDSKADVNAKDSKGNTPLLMVFTSLNDTWVYTVRKEDFAKLIEITEQKLKVLLKAGADVTAKNNNNETVLHFVVNYLKNLRKKHFDENFRFNDSKIIQLVNLLMSYNQNIDVNVRNNDNESPLLLAISYLSVCLVKLFLKKKADLKGLKFNEKAEFFNYPYGILTLQPLENLISILELLSSKGCILEPEDNLAVLKFLLHDGKSSGIMGYSFKSDIFHMMCVESSTHLGKFLYNFHVDFKYDRMNLVEDGHFGYPENSEEYLDYYDELHTYLSCINEAKAYIHADSQILLKDTLNECKKVDGSYNPSVESEEIYEDLDNLESIVLVNGKRMSDILVEKPEEAANYFGANKFDKSCLQNLIHFRGIVKGHVTLALVRNLVIKTSYSIVMNSNSTPLHYVCYEFITDYLSNKDILNWCLAVLT